MRMASLLFQLAAVRGVALRSVAVRRHAFEVDGLSRMAAAPLCCSRAASTAAASINIFFARPVRALLQPPRRQEQLSLAPSDAPLQTVWQALTEQLPAESLPVLCLHHGKRRISSEAELSEVCAPSGGLAIACLKGSIELLLHASTANSTGAA